MGTGFKENDMINPLPQRTARHTNHDKEYACLLKGKKKRNVHFCSSFKKFDQVARKCLGMAMYILRQGRRAVKMAGRVVCVVRPPGTAHQSHCHSAFSPVETSPAPFLPKAPQPCACGAGTGLPLGTAGRGVGFRATWPSQAGSELW